MYAWKALPTAKELKCGGLPYAMKLKLTVSMLSGSLD